MEIKQFKVGDKVLVPERFRQGNYYHTEILAEVRTNKYLVKGTDLGKLGKLPARAIPADLITPIFS